MFCLNWYLFTCFCGLFPQNFISFLPLKFLPRVCLDWNPSLFGAFGLFNLDALVDGFCCLGLYLLFLGQFLVLEWFGCLTCLWRHSNLYFRCYTLLNFVERCCLYFYFRVLHLTRVGRLSPPAASIATSFHSCKKVFAFIDFGVGFCRNGWDEEDREPSDFCSCFCGRGHTRSLWWCLQHLPWSLLQQWSVNGDNKFFLVPL